MSFFNDIFTKDKTTYAREFGEAVVETGREEKGEDLEIKVEGGPGGGLVLGHGGDDRNVVLGIGGVQ